MAVLKSSHGTQIAWIVPGTKLFGNGSPAPCLSLPFTGRLTSVIFILKNILPVFVQVMVIVQIFAIQFEIKLPPTLSEGILEFLLVWDIF